MDVPVLVCACGMRVRAPGATPGRIGRCPRCGGRLEMPATPPLESSRPLRNGADIPTEAGYGLTRNVAEIELPPDGPKPKRKRPRREAPGPTRNRGPVADGPLSPLSRPEKSWFVSFLYPLRGAESLGVIGALALISWGFYGLVPEYCIQLMQDAGSMGGGLLGQLFMMITGTPVLILSPFVFSYSLQYLGRVLVSSAMGETTPPHSPQRNFDGFFNGLSPWLVWFVLGLGVGLLPAAWYVFSKDGESVSLGIALVLGLAGIPYILAALMMSFLHDDGLAPKPWAVLLGLIRLGASFWALSVFIGVTVALALGIFALVVLIRSHLYWLYLPLSLVPGSSCIGRQSSSCACWAPITSTTRTIFVGIVHTLAGVSPGGCKSNPRDFVGLVVRSSQGCRVARHSSPSSRTVLPVSSLKISSL